MAPILCLSFDNLWHDTKRLEFVETIFIFSRFDILPHLYFLCCDLLGFSISLNCVFLFNDAQLNIETIFQPFSTRKVLDVIDILYVRPTRLCRRVVHRCWPILVLPGWRVYAYATWRGVCLCRDGGEGCMPMPPVKVSAGKDANGGLWWSVT